MPLGMSELKTGILVYVGSMKKPAGGYGATTTLPATVEDTYYALNILSALNKQEITDDNALKNYLSGLRGKEWMGARTTFHFLAACRMAKVPVEGDKTVNYVKKRLAKTGDLIESYYCARILRDILEMKDDSLFEQFGRYDVDPAWRDVSELWMKIYLLNHEKIGRKMTSRQELITWLQACQNNDGGFGFLPGSTSFIENCHTCLQALLFLNSGPVDIPGCLSFIVSSRTATGGFARAHKATAFLYSTWDGVASLLLMKAI